MLHTKTQVSYFMVAVLAFWLGACGVGTNNSGHIEGSKSMASGEKETLPSKQHKDDVDRGLFKVIEEVFSDPSIEKVSQRSRLVSISKEYLPNTSELMARGEIIINLFSDLVLTVQREKSQRSSTGSIIWTGKVRGYEGGQALLVIKDEMINGTITLPAVGNFSIQSRTSGEHIIFQRKELNDESPDWFDGV